MDRTRREGHGAFGAFVPVGIRIGLDAKRAASEKAPPGIMATIVIRNRKTGEGLKYSIAEEWLPTILSWTSATRRARFDEAMAAEHLFKSEPAP